MKKDYTKEFQIIGFWIIFIAIVGLIVTECLKHSK